MLWKFGNGGSLEQHGFVRNKIWAIDDNPPPLRPNDSHGKSFTDLILRPSEEDLKCWPHRYESLAKPYVSIWFKYCFADNKMAFFFFASFEFRLRVSLATDGDLNLISRVRNVNCKPFSFSFAYHTYFSVSDIRYGKLFASWCTPPPKFLFPTFSAS